MTRLSRGLCVFAVVLGLVTSCTKEAQRAAVHVEQAACEVVDLVTDAPIPETLCLVADDLAQLAERLDAAQAKGARSLALEVHSPSGERTAKLVKLPLNAAEVRRARARIAAPAGSASR